MRRAGILRTCLDGAVQIGLLVGLVELYRLLHKLMSPDWPLAIANAHHVLRLEQLLGVAWERPLQAAFLHVHDAVAALNFFYLSAHFIVTGLFFVWLFFRSRDGFALFRDGFLLGTAITLVIHWTFPVAPPRLADVGVQDTIRLFSHVDIGSPVRERFANPVAAVPSLHAAWAFLVGAGVVLYGRWLWLRALGVAYPLVAVLAIVVTGNHFFFDAAAGIFVMAAGFAAGAVLRSRAEGGILAPATRGGAVR